MYVEYRQDISIWLCSLGVVAKVNDNSKRGVTSDCCLSQNIDSQRHRSGRHTIFQSLLITEWRTMNNLLNLIALRSS